MWGVSFLDTQQHSSTALEIDRKDRKYLTICTALHPATGKAVQINITLKFPSRFSYCKWYEIKCNTYEDTSHLPLSDL